MVDYASMVTNKTGTFPNVAAKNASSAGGTDGTEYVAAILNDIWGFWQNILAQANQTPNGTTEAAAALGAAVGAGQQKYGALQVLGLGTPGEAVFDFIAPGTGTYGSQSMSWGAAAGGPPTRYQYRRVLVCTGQFVQASLYPDMAQAIYCGDANNATATYCYYTSDAGGTTRSTVSKNYIKLPDMRGVTIRGYDHGGIHDPAGGTRGSFGEIASLQQDALQGHWHPVDFSGTPTGGVWGANGGAASNNVAPNTSAASLGGGPLVSKGAITDGISGSPRTDKETRMYNVSVNAGIRY